MEELTRKEKHFMPYLVLVTILLCLLALTSQAAYASGTEIKGKVITQNETENDYVNIDYKGGLATLYTEKP